MKTTTQHPGIAKVQADNAWEDLVISILSVNQYSLELETHVSIDRRAAEAGLI